MSERRFLHPLVGYSTRTGGGWEPVVLPDPPPAYTEVDHVRAIRAHTQIDGDGRTLEGIASPFNAETVVNSFWEGKFREVIRPGAFERTLREDRQIIQFDHGMSHITDSLPLGPIDVLEERDEGLYVRARLRDTPLINEVRAAIADGTIDGMSIQFRVRVEQVTEFDSPDELTLRELLDVRLFELGPVVWPAYPQTTVAVRTDSTMGESQPGAEGTGTGHDANTDDAAFQARLAVLRVRLRHTA